MEGWCSYGVPGVLEGRKIANGDVHRYFNEKEHCIKKVNCPSFFTVDTVLGTDCLNEPPRFRKSL